MLKIINALKYALQGAVELVMFFPLLLACGIYVTHADEKLWLWIGWTPLFYILGIVLQTLFSMKITQTRFVVSGVGSYLAAMPLSETPYQLILTAVLGAFLCYRGMLMVNLPWDTLFPVPYYWVGLFIYFASYFVYKLTFSLSEYLPVVTWLGVCSLVLCLYFSNWTQLRNAAMSGNRQDQLPRSVVRQNRLLVLAFVLFVFTLAAFQQMMNLLIVWLKKFIAWLFSLMQESEEAEQPSGVIDEPVMPVMDGEPSAAARLLEQIITYIVVGILLIGGAVMVWFVLREIARLMAQLWRWLRRSLLKRSIGSGNASGFIDEEASLLDWSHMPRRLSERFRRWLAVKRDKEPAWDELSDNRERARFLYARLLLRQIAAGYRWKRQFSARETGRDLIRWDPLKSQGRLELDEFMRLYDEARFGEAVPDDGQIERMLALRERIHRS